MEERFAPIEGFPKYRISDQGRVINSRGKEKAQQIARDGYKKLNLYRDGKGSTKRISRLVAEAFVENPDNKPDVNHLDGNKLNNHYTNLEWATKSENMLHAYRTGLAKPTVNRAMLGRKNPNAGSKGRKVMIVETGEIFNSVKACAEAINGSDRRICDCVNGKQHTHCGYHFAEA